MEMQDLPPETSRRSQLLMAARASGTSPGVYLLKDAQGHILYVGKAKNLRNRVSTYFQSAVHEVARLEMLVSRVDHFDVILTQTESEALILESTLIKKHKPRFNIRLKDDKTYPYLKLNFAHTYPRIELTRRLIQDDARYFGPFPSAWSARRVMALLNLNLQLRDCSDNTFRHRSRPCVLYQMKRCVAPCTKLIGVEQYREKLREVTDVLEGRSSRITEMLERLMTQKAEAEDYEGAAYFRDELQNLQLITQTQSAFALESLQSRDVMNIARQESQTHGTLLHVVQGRLVAVDHFSLTNTDPSQTDAEILVSFLTQHYAKRARSGVKYREDELGFQTPREDASDSLEVLVPDALGDGSERRLLEETFRLSLRNSLNAVDEQILSVAQTNALYALAQSIKKEGGHGFAALEEIQNLLGLLHLPHRIECYDISNISGQDSVASRVVFIDGGPDKNLYRRYKIKTVIGANDFASMREVLGRRFAAHNEEELPDLVVVDGGKGQLAEAVAIFDELAIQGVGLVGLAKARTEGNFRASAVRASDERLFLPGRNIPIPLGSHTRSFRLFTHIRDEAHRFAITYHRKLRSKRSLHSENKPAKRPSSRQAPPM